jgi:hypothetical protein
MSAHTPGPWLAPDESDGADIWPVESDTGEHIADVYSAFPDDARLIAAAPELLEALRGMLEWARRVEQRNPGLEVAHAATAIAKAEGRTP